MDVTATVESEGNNWQILINSKDLGIKSLRHFRGKSILQL